MKLYAVIFMPRAERQLSDLYNYIADRNGESRADNYISAIVADCKSLSVFPERGTKRDDIRPNLRIKGYSKRVTIAFSINAADQVVAIHGIFYGGQNFELILLDDDLNS